VKRRQASDHNQCVAYVSLAHVHMSTVTAAVSQIAPPDILDLMAHYMAHARRLSCSPALLEKINRHEPPHVEAAQQEWDRISAPPYRNICLYYNYDEVKPMTDVTHHCAAPTKRPVVMATYHPIDSAWCRERLNDPTPAGHGYTDASQWHDKYAAEALETMEFDLSSGGHPAFSTSYVACVARCDPLLSA
jgi:hypothetical protein